MSPGTVASRDVAVLWARRGCGWRRLALEVGAPCVPRRVQESCRCDGGPMGGDVARCVRETVASRAIGWLVKSATTTGRARSGARASERSTRSAITSPAGAVRV